MAYFITMTEYCIMYMKTQNNYKDMVKRILNPKFCGTYNMHYSGPEYNGTVTF